MLFSTYLNKIMACYGIFLCAIYKLPSPQFNYTIIYYYAARTVYLRVQM